MQIKLTTAEKKQLWIFIAVAFGMPIVMGILMGISFYRGNDVSVFPNAQMYYPAAGVMLAYILTRKKEEKLPMKFYVSFIILTGVMTVTAIISMILPEIPFVMIIQYIIIIGSLLLWIPFLMDKKKSEEITVSVLATVRKEGLGFMSSFSSYCISCVSF